MPRKKVVTIGGGSGSFSLLSGLKKYALRDDKDKSIYINFTAASTDSGQNSGEIRDAHGTLPPGDMRQALIALLHSGNKEKERLWKELLGYRFNNEVSRLNGYSTGNVVITGATEKWGEKKGWDNLHILFDVKGRIMPSTWDKRDIEAIYEDGTIRSKEHNIDKFENPNRSRVERLYLTKDGNANTEALEAIASADAIIMGPGDLYTSVICNFLCKEIGESIRKSKGLKIYNCNIMTKIGETPNYSVADHFNDLEKYLGKGVIDVITYNNKYNFDEKLLEGYKKENKMPVRLKESERIDSKVKLIGADLSSETDIIRHDSEKISELMMEIIFP